MISTLASVSPQIDGRRWVDELHVDPYGVEHPVAYMAGPDDDLDAALAARAIEIAASLKAGEIAANIEAVKADGAQATIALRYSTFADNGTALAGIATTITGTDALFVGEYLSTQSAETLAYASGWPLDAVQALLVTKFQPYAALAAQIREARV